MILEKYSCQNSISTTYDIPDKKNKYDKIDPWQIFPRHGRRCKSTMLPTVKGNLFTGTF